MKLEARAEGLEAKAEDKPRPSQGAKPRPSQGPKPRPSQSQRLDPKPRRSNDAFSAAERAPAVE